MSLYNLFTVPIDLLALRGHKQEQPNVAQSQKGGSILHTDTSSKKRWTRLKGIDKAILVSEEQHEHLLTTEGKKRRWSLQDEEDEVSLIQENNKRPKGKKNYQHGLTQKVGVASLNCPQRDQ